MSRAVQKQKGMTLPEVMVALLVFSLISASSVYALRLGVDSRDQLEAADAELKSLQLARILIKEDLAQIVARPVRNEFGEQGQFIFEGGQSVFGGRIEDDERILFSFVRGGRINPGALAPRSALQHVEYVFRDGAVVRRSRSFVDETTNSETVERIIFDDIQDARAEFLNGQVRGELDWADAWPVGGNGRPPRAVAVITEKENTPPLRQLFWIGGLGEAGASS